MNITKVHGYTHSELLRHFALGKPKLSNQDIFNLAVKFNDSLLKQNLVESKSAQVVVNPRTKKRVYKIEEGYRFCFLFMKTFKADIEKEREKYYSPEACEKRDAVKRDIYNTELAVYDGKVKVEHALDEIYVVSKVPVALFTEGIFQRRSKAEKKTFASEHKPKEPIYEFSLNPHLRESEASNRETEYDPSNYVMRLENALAILNRQYGLLCHLPSYANMAVKLEGQDILLSDILFNRDHPQYQFARLKHVLENPAEAEEEIKPSDENNSEELIVLTQQLREIRAAVLTEFSVDQQCAKTHQTIRDHNEKVAIEFFRTVYLSMRRSYAGTMHDKVVKKQIRSFAEIEKYACENQDYFESKTREILREYEAGFNTIRYSPLFMYFEFVPRVEFTIRAAGTFLQTAEAETYARWYQERCPKYRTDKEFIEKFSNLYNEIMNRVALDKIKKWIREGQIFSHKQLTQIAKAKPNSEVATILKSLASRLELLECHEQEVEGLTIQSQHYIDTEERQNEEQEMTYLKFERKCVTYTPPKQGERDGINQMQLVAENQRKNSRVRNVESRLYNFFRTSIVAQ